MPAMPAMPVLRRSSVALLAFTLAGCTSTLSLSGDRAPSPSCSQVSVDVPGALAKDQAMASVVGVVGRNGALPALMVGTRTTVADGGRVATWSPKEAGGWSWHQPSTREERESRAALVLSDGATTWLAGTSWAVGKNREPYLMTSGDRASWADAPLPREAVRAGFSPEEGVLVDGRPLLVGLDARDRAVAVTPGDKGRVVALPPLPKGTRVTRVSALAADGEQVLAVLSTSRGGEPPRNVAALSGDGGTTWMSVTAPADQRASVNGLVRAGDRWVATGSTTDDNSSSSMAAWSSGDARSWAAEGLPAPEEIGEAANWWTDVSTHLEGVVGDGDGLVSPAVNLSHLTTALLRRDASGAWSMAGSTDAWDGAGVGPAVGHGDDGVVIARSSGGGAALGMRVNDRSWRDRITVGDRHEAAGSLTFTDGTTAPLLASTLVTTTRGDGWWTSTHRLDPLTMSGPRAMATTAWDPPGAEGLTSLQRATAPDGAQAVMGSRVDQEGFTGRLEGWYRTGADSAWQPMTGFPDDGSNEPTTVLATAQGWIAVGHHRAASVAGELSGPRVWTSSDGVRWQQVPDEQLSLEEVDGNTEVLGACTLPDGDAFAVGYATRDGEIRPAAWRRTGDAWAPVDVSGVKAQRGGFSGCTEASNAVVVSGESGLDDAAWRTIDGSMFDRVALGTGGDDVELVRAVPGGTVAVGTLGSRGRSGAVLWLSTDGKTWRPLAVPGGAATDGSDVTADGDDLVVTGVSETGPRAWRLADYRTQLTKG